MGFNSEVRAKRSTRETEAEIKKIKPHISFKETKDNIIIYDNREECKNVIKFDGLKSLELQAGKEILEQKMCSPLLERPSLIIDGVKISFPFKPYPCQIQLMSKILKCLKSGKNEHALLESPTGTGKTLSLLCSVLGWLSAIKINSKVREFKAKIEPDELIINGHSDAKGEVPKDPDAPDAGSVPRIYFASRTHKQLSQVVKELRRTPHADVRHVVLASRSNYCINERVKDRKDINEACLEEIEVGRCKYLNKIEKFIKEGSICSAMGKNVEELVEFGKQKTLCPYFLSREAAEECEIVFCPFDYILNPTIRESLGLQIKGSIIILDEAHNIEDVCRESGGFEASDGDLFAIRSELDTFYDPATNSPSSHLQNPNEHWEQRQVVAILYSWLFNTPWKVGDEATRGFERDVEIWQNEDMLKTLALLGFTEVSVSRLSKMLADIENERKKSKEKKDDDNHLLLSQGSCRLLESLYRTLKSLFANNGKDLPSFRLFRQRENRYGNRFLISCNVDSEKGKQQVFILGIWCLNPAIVFTEIAQSARSVILTSGTLSPTETFSSELGVHFEHRLEAMHVIDPGQVWVGAISIGPEGHELKGTFKELETFIFQDEIAKSLVEVVTRVPDGVLCFLPSYSFLDKLLKRMEATGALDLLKREKKIFTEPRQGGTKEFERLMRSYYRTIESRKGAIFFAVFRGKVSEGLDFSDENARAVVSVGIPFPALKDEKVVQKRMYNDLYSKEKGLLNGHLWYDKQAYRALNQALGRCIRHRNDWGAVILLEKRFLADANINSLSKWIRPQVQRFDSFCDAMGSLEKYLEVRKSHSASDQKAKIEDFIDLSESE